MHLRNLLQNQIVINSRNFNQLVESTKMAISVSIPTILRPYTGNARTIELSGDSIQNLIANLDQKFPGLGDRLLEDGKLRRFVNIYVNDDYEGGEITFFDYTKAEVVEYKDSFSEIGRAHV